MGGRTILSDEEDEFDEEEDGEGARETEPADVDEHEDDEEEDEDEDEEGQDEYEKDGFIVDDVDEEEDRYEEEERESNEEEKHKKKKRKKRESEKNYVLDEDDYELLQDNNITGFRRPKPGSKRFKRLKKAGRDTGNEERSGFSDEEEVDRTGQSSRTAEEKLKRSLFGDDEGAPLEDIAEEEEQPEEEEDADIGDEDEMADFIVDEEEVDENGAVVRKKKPKKKMSRQAPGISSSALQEAHDIFGDVDELLMLRKQGLTKNGNYNEYGEWKEKRLEDEFEPFIISEKYMTEKDDHIREVDVPERIQLSEEITGPIPADDESIEAESTWIYNQLVHSFMSPFFKKDDREHGNARNKEDGNYLARKINKDDIGNVLGMMHIQRFDIPFIATYRKELCLSLLNEPEEDGSFSDDNADEKDGYEKTRTLKWHKMLWAIQNLDKKWLLLQKRKNSLQLYYNKRFAEETQRVEDENRLELNQELFKSITKFLEKAETEREVDDVDMKFNLHFPPGEVDVEEGQYKKPKRKSWYTTCSKAGLWEVARKFGYSSEQFGALLNLDKMDLVLVDPKETPEEVAGNFTCALFQTAEDVLKGARHMAAVEISCEPWVRKHVRGTFMDHAVVSTCPTPEGNAAIDSFHQFYGIKWIKNKPISRFNDAQWLLIQRAEEEKLVKVTIGLPEEQHNKLIGYANESYLSDGVSRSAQLWNEQRKLILKDALFNSLLPSMEKEVRQVLTARAKQWLMVEYGQHLWNKVSVAPYQRKDTDAGSDDESAPRVMACCWGSGKPATTFVMLDSSGEVLDVLYTGSLSVRSQSVNEQQRKKNDQQRVLKFMTDHQPHVVVLGAVNLACTRLKDDIYEIIFKMVEEHPREVGQEMDGISVVYGDESLPRLYENSRISLDQLQGQSGIVKRAVALGRYLQNPLAMVATLCGPGREILSWKLSPLDQFLSSDEKYQVVEQILIDATNQVGVDINLASSHEWLFAPLQFVSGLGPRKASALQRALVRAGSIFSRKEIPMNGVLKKKVFINCVGFLRVRRSGGATASSHIIDLLDDTRIHPESYELAKNMAKDVYAEDVQEDHNDMDDDVQEMAIEHVRERPTMLRTLDIPKYAESIESGLGTRKRETLYDIKMELLHGFQDWRHPYREPSQDEEFYMISGETEDTIAEGRIVQVTVRRVQLQRISCVLESGLPGLIFKEDLSDDRDSDAIEKIKEGDILTCKIKSIQKNRYQAFLTCKGSDLRRKSQNTGKLDPYYFEDESSLRSEQEKARKEKELSKKHFKSRMIVHPRFQNVTAAEAIEFLSDKEPGESIIRPSSRGPSFLTLTLKVYDGVYAHKDVVEGGKDHKDITSLLRLGKILKIGEDTFEDLDEVMDRYVDPLVGYLKTMLSYRKFRKGTKAEVDDLLRMEKSDNPMRIVYCFGICYDHPGTFTLSYIRSTNPHHEYIGLYPKGFKFRKKMFENIDRLVAYFQRHIDDLQHESVPSIRSVAAMVPMRSPAPDGSVVGSAWGDSPARNSESGWGSRSNSDRDRSSLPGSRTGRSDYRNSGGRDGHPNIPRPRSRHGSHVGSESRDSGFGSSKWGSDSKEDDGWSSFPGAKVHNSPGKEAFPGNWGSGNNWGGSGNENSHGGTGGYDSGRGSVDRNPSRNSGWDNGKKSNMF